MSDRFVTVTKDKFFDYVKPRDIVLRIERETTYWETRNRAIVGYSTPGYANPCASRTFHLARDAEALCRPVSKR